MKAIKQIKKKCQRMIKLMKGHYSKLHKLNTQTFIKMKKIILSCIIFLVTLVTISCNVTRTITTTQTHIKGQDTVATLTTQTKESYDGSIKPKNL